MSGTLTAGGPGKGGAPAYRPLHWGAFVAIVLIAFAVRTIGLGDQSLWYDEGYSVMLSRRDAGLIVEQTARLDFNTPAHYLLLRGWIELGGSSEFSARLLSVFAGVATVALVAQLVAMPPILRRREPFARALAMGLLAVSPMAISVAQEARMYAWLTCFCTLAAVQLCRCLRSQAAGAWALWVVWNWAAFLTHVIGAVFFAAQALVIAAWWTWSLFLSLNRRGFRLDGRLWPMAAIAVAGAGMALYVLYILSFGRGYGVTFDSRLWLAPTLVQSLAAASLPHLQPAILIEPLAWLGLALLAGAGGAVVHTRNRRAMLVLAVAATGLAAIAAFGAWSGKFGQRYPSIVAPLLFAGAGSAAASIGWPVVAVAFASVSGLLSAAGIVAWRTDPVYAFPDFRGAAAHVRSRIAPDETVLLVAGHFAPVFEYYYGSHGWTALPNDPVLDVRNPLDYDSAVPALNRDLAGKNGAWLLLWQDGIVDPTGVTEALLRRQSVELRPRKDLQQFHNLRLQHYRFFSPYQPLPAAMPVTRSTVELTDRQRGLGSMGCAQLVQPRAGQGFLEVVCFWSLEPGEHPLSSLQVSLRLVDEAGRQVLQSDQSIAPRGLPSIPYHKPIAAFYSLPMPGDIKPGSYTLHAIPYTSEEEISPRVHTPVQVLP